MKLTKDLASNILTGLNNDTLKWDADEPAEGDDDLQEWVDAIADVADEHGYNMISALAQYVSDRSEDVQAFELGSFITEHYKISGYRVGDVLKDHAQNAEYGDLCDLFTALDNAGAVDWFDWDGYADSRETPLDGLNFIVVPATGTSKSVFLFED